MTTPEENERSDTVLHDWHARASLSQHARRMRLLHEEARLHRLVRVDRRRPRRSVRRTVGDSLIRVGTRLAPEAAHLPARAR